MANDQELEKERKIVKADINIREAKLEDLKGICRVEKNSFPPEDRYSEHNFQTRLEISISKENSWRKYFVAEENGEIIGYGEVSMKSPDQIMGYDNLQTIKEQIEKLDDRIGILISSGVLIEKRKKGIGSMITNARLDYLQKNNIEQVFVQAWPRGGFSYLAKKFGFKKIEGVKGRAFSDGTHQELYYKSLKD